MRKYVVAFRGRRDDYQVPLALAETDALETFITDAYAFGAIRDLLRLFPNRFFEALRQRFKQGIPDSRIKCLWKTTFRERTLQAAGIAGEKVYASTDPDFSRAAAKEARNTHADLFLYTPYAWEAFRESYKHQPRRILFQYHPHSAAERRLLQQDVEEHPGVKASYRAETGQQLPQHARRRIDDAWKHADHIICASSFTRDTLVAAGASGDTCSVIPYGIPHRNIDLSRSLPKRFEVLFVGSGVQRKGLHHLLSAWDDAKLPDKSRLTLVCRVLDPGIKAQASNTEGVRLLKGVSKARLHQLYQSSTLFAMPSLVEGFGQVYLEALSFGCPVLGTTNTCLPDLGDDSNGVFIVRPGWIKELTARLESLANQLPGSSEARVQAAECASRFTWTAFRRELRHVLDKKSSSIAAPPPVQ